MIALEEDHTHLDRAVIASSRQKDVKVCRSSSWLHRLDRRRELDHRLRRLSRPAEVGLEYPCSGRVADDDQLVILGALAAGAEVGRPSSQDCAVDLVRLQMLQRPAELHPYSVGMDKKRP